MVLFLFQYEHTQTISIIVHFITQWKLTDFLFDFSKMSRAREAKDYGEKGKSCQKVNQQYKIQHITMHRFSISCHRRLCL